MIDVRRLQDLWRRRDVAVRDLPPALLLAAVSLLPGTGDYGTQLGALPHRPFDALTVAVVALECLPLVVRRRWPAACLALVALGFAVDQLHGFHTFATIALPVALLSAGAHLERHRRTAAVLVSAAYVPLAVALERRGVDEGVAGYVTFYLALAIAWGAGAWLRLSRETEAERRRHVAETTRAAERTRIARELHDELAQWLTALKMDVSWIRSHLPQSETQLIGKADRMKGVVDNTIAAMRRIAADLRPVMLDDLGLMPAIENLLHDLSERTGIQVSLTGSAELEALREPLVTAVYRMVQEALTNVARHSGATRVRVALEIADERLALSIRDNGSGFNPDPNRKSFGVLGIRERARTLGGDAHIHTPPGGGTEVEIEVPLARYMQAGVSA